MQRRSLYLLLAALFFTGSRVVAQTTAADQNFKTIPQQIKTTAEVKATNRANVIANDATDKIDSGMSKAYRGLLKMFGKKRKPGAGAPAQDSVGTGVTPPMKDSAAVVAPMRDSVAVVTPKKQGSL
jgi:hypothetical protein